MKIRASACPHLKISLPWECISPASPTNALPQLVFKESFQLFLNNEDVGLGYIPPAHIDTDILYSVPLEQPAFLERGTFVRCVAIPAPVPGDSHRLLESSSRRRFLLDHFRFDFFVTSRYPEAGIVWDASGRKTRKFCARFH